MSIHEKKRSTKKLDNTQLKQRIIHLQAELSRYKEIVANYQNNYHYSQFEELNNNIQILKQKVEKQEVELEDMKASKKEVEELVKQLIEEKELANNNYTELKGQFIELEEEKSRLKEENENLQQVLISNEEEEEPEEVEEVVREKNNPNPTQAIISKETATDSWFIRTLKQQNKKDH